MTPRLKNEIARLRSKGVRLDDLTPEELVEFIHAVERCDNPYSRVNADAIGIPVEVCDGVYFWRLSIGAIVWLEEFAGKWFADRPEANFWATAYACHHSREKEAFIKLTTEEAAYEAIRDDILQLPCTADEVTRAVNICLDIDIPQRPIKKVCEARNAWEAIIRRLEVGSGIKRDEWLYGCSYEYAIEAHADLIELGKALNGGGGKHSRDQLDKAVEALEIVKVRIVKRVTAEKAKEANE